MEKILKGLKPVILVILISFGAVAIRLDNLAYAMEDARRTNESQRSQKSSAVGDFSREMGEINRLISKKRDGKQISDEDLETIKVNLKNVKKLGEEVREEFEATEKFLKQKGISYKILQRHYEFVKNFEDKMEEMDGHFNELEYLTAPAWQKSIKKLMGKKIPNISPEEKIIQIKEFLDKNSHKPKHTPLNPNKLPHRSIKLPHREPKLFPQKTQNDRKNGEEKIQESKSPQSPNHPITQSPNHLITQITQFLKDFFITSAEAADLPTEADLVETIDVQITDEIRTLATETLQSNPVLIYEYVRNNFDYEPYYGSLKGSQETLWEKAGNDFDQASLLIALYRAAGIPARYVYGTIEIPIEQAMSWVGVKDAKTCGDIFASGGIPSGLVLSGGKITKIRMEHCWAEVWINYLPSRGTINQEMGKQWIPLDPSFSLYKYVEREGVDLDSAIASTNFNAEYYIEQYSGQPLDDWAAPSVQEDFFQQDLQDYSTQIYDYLTTNDFPEITVEVREKETESYGILPASLNYVVLNQTIFSDIPASYRHTINFTVGNASYSIDIPLLCGERITLSYIPASEEDLQFASNYTKISEIPAYLLNLSPTLKIDSVVQLTGESVSLGSIQIFTITISAPAGYTDIIENEVTAGAYYGIGIDVGSVPSALLELHANKLDTISNLGTQMIGRDDVIGSLLYLISMTYFSQLDLYNKITARNVGVINTRFTSEAIAAIDLKVAYLFNYPIGVSIDGLSLDVDLDLHSPFPIDGDIQRSVEFMIQSGLQGSMREHLIFEQFFSNTELVEPRAISAFKALLIANNDGIPIYGAVRGNISEILPKLELSEDIKDNITDFVNSGKLVLVPKTSIQYEGWENSVYLVIDMDTGAVGSVIADKNGALLKKFIEFADILDKGLSAFENTMDPKSAFGDKVLEYITAIKINLIGVISLCEKLSQHLKTFVGYIDAISTTIKEHLDEFKRGEISEGQFKAIIAFTIAVKLSESLWNAYIDYAMGKIPILQALKLDVFLKDMMSDFCAKWIEFSMMILHRTARINALIMQI